MSDRGDPLSDLDFAAMVHPSLSEHEREIADATVAAIFEREIADVAAIIERVDEDTTRAAVASGLDTLILSKAPSAPTVPHSTYLGASDLGAILGLDPFRTPLDVWASKTGRLARADAPDDIEAEAGNDHEAGVIAGAVRKLKRLGVLVSHEYPGPGTMRGREAPFDGNVLVPPQLAGQARYLLGLWRGATLDAVVTHREHGEVPLEAKMVGVGLAHLWGPELAGGAAIPERVLAQVHWQALHLRETHFARVPIAYVAADICGTDRRLYEVVIDDEMIDDLLAAARAWWLRHVIHDEMPTPNERDLETLRRVFPEPKRPLSPFVPDEVRLLAEDYAIGREITMRHHVETQKIAAKLCAVLGEAEGYKWRGGKVTWRTDAQGRRRLYVKVRPDNE